MKIKSTIKSNVIELKLKGEVIAITTRLLKKQKGYICLKVKVDDSNRKEFLKLYCGDINIILEQIKKGVDEDEN